MTPQFGKLTLDRKESANGAKARNCEPAKKYYLIHFPRSLTYKTSSRRATKEISLVESWIWKTTLLQVHHVLDGGIGARIRKGKEASRNIYYLIISQAHQIMRTIYMAREGVSKHMVIIG